MTNTLEKPRFDFDALADVDNWPIEDCEEFDREFRRDDARGSLLDFMRWCWRNPAAPLVVGDHTRDIAARLDRALDDLAKGQSTYLIVTLPFRHGKSDLVSRYFPPYLLGRDPDREIILATYGAALSEELSRDARAILQSPEYGELFPAVKLDGAQASVAAWAVEGRRGKVRAVGLDGAVTGRGAEVLLVDDYLKGRAEAESETIRNGIWEGLTNNLMTRLAPAHIVVILATRWHQDDVIGRILAKMADKDAPNFPRFEVMHFKARQDDGSWLFPDRFPASWYETQFAQLGAYAASALLQGEPTVRGGNRFRVGNIKFVDAMPSEMLWVRFWDLASRAKQRDKPDPDYTVGARCAVTVTLDGVPSLFVDDVVWIQAEAPERNQLIYRTIKRDGAAVWQGIEAVAGYIDTATTTKDLFRGRSIVHEIAATKDKTERAACVEPVMEAGNVTFLRAWWRDEVVKQLGEFPSGVHDDIVDAISGGFALARERWEQRGQFGAFCPEVDGGRLWGRAGRGGERGRL